MKNIPINNILRAEQEIKASEEKKECTCIGPLRRIGCPVHYPQPTEKPQPPQPKQEWEEEFDSRFNFTHAFGKDSMAEKNIKSFISQAIQIAVEEAVRKTEKRMIEEIEQFLTLSVDGASFDKVYIIYKKEDWKKLKKKLLTNSTK